MSIPTSGLAALLVVATFALSSCGSDDGAATATTTQASGSGSTVVQTVTQTATATAGSTTSQPATTTTSAPKAAKPKPSTTTSKASPAKPTPTTCAPVLIGIRDGEVDETYARITQQRNVSDCPTVTAVVSEWGKQQIGIDRALLPNGWRCTSRNACKNGNARVEFVLEKLG